MTWCDTNPNWNILDLKLIFNGLALLHAHRVCMSFPFMPTETGYQLSTWNKLYFGGFQALGETWFFSQFAVKLSEFVTIWGVVPRGSICILLPKWKHSTWSEWTLKINCWSLYSNWCVLGPCHTIFCEFCLRHVLSSFLWCTCLS